MWESRQTQVLRFVCFMRRVAVYVTILKLIIILCNCCVAEIDYS